MNLYFSKYGLIFNPFSLRHTMVESSILSEITLAFMLLYFDLQLTKRFNALFSRMRATLQLIQGQQDILPSVRGWDVDSQKVNA